MHPFELDTDRAKFDDVSVVATLELSGPTDVGACRRALSKVAAGTWIGARIADLVLVASELASNAIEHGSAPVRCRFLLSDERAVLALFDADPRPPKLHDEDGSSMPDERHRGLQMVEAVSDRCGYVVDAGRGKWVFAEWWSNGPPAPDLEIRVDD
ncbi:MAG: Magnesium or manganese-dependent protein phosphatase [Actinomycetia bacterium]|nr:Magnesium or manganese-dependent protein phosphatase [Actinomycetes bacterium]